MNMKEIFKKIDGYKNFVIDMQTGMMQCPSISTEIEGGVGEYDKAVFIDGVLKGMKFDEVFHLDAKDPKAKKGVRPNIIAKYYGKNRDKNFWIMAHMDVVSPGDLAMWKTDPFKAVVQGDKIYGRGSEDNHQGLISALAAVKAFMELGIRPEVNLCLLIVADEEVGSVYGIQHIIKTNLKMFKKGDCVMVPDGGNSEGTDVMVAEKSIYWAKFTVTGKQVHASTPEAGINAYRAGANLIVELDKELHKKFNKKDKLFSPSVSTFEPTKKYANVASSNIVPGKDEFHFDCRVLPLYKLSEVKKTVNAVVKKISGQFKVKVDIAVTQEVESPATDVKEPVVTQAIAAIKAVYKNKPKAIGIGGGTVGAYLRKEGIPCAVYSKLDDVAHQPNEYSKISDTLGDAKVFAIMALNLK
ncbi:MAG: M20 family metallo-hydrolase [Elusimicrobium sp.]|jgi:succinyl-diaminopimelate desuccinylase|nr:M20 family metallo-hydrolase [Elusimicrobium sp.]